MSAKKLLALLAIAAPAVAFDYDIVGAGSIVLTDAASSISPLETIFVNEETLVTAEGLEWVRNGNSSDLIGGTIFYETYLSGVLMAKGNVSLDGVGRELPTSVDAGSVTVTTGGGRYTVEVILTVGESSASTTNEYEAYGSAVAIIPIAIIIVLAIMTNMVRLLLLCRSECFAGIQG